jgi:hypothetical protein
MAGAKKGGWTFSSIITAFPVLLGFRPISIPRLTVQRQLPVFGGNSLVCERIEPFACNLSVPSTNRDENLAILTLYDLVTVKVHSILRAERVSDSLALSFVESLKNLCSHFSHGFILRFV